MSQSTADKGADSRAPVVLVVDDDAAIRTVVRWQLDDAGFRVVEADDGDTALRRIRDDHPTLVVLDLSLPRLGGLDVLRAVRGGRAGRSDLPVIVLSGRNGETDRIVGLDLGADDYLVKPFSPGELAARVRSVLRRSSPELSGEVVVVGDLRIDPGSRRVLVGDREVELTPKEFDLLSFLATHPSHVYTRGQLVDRVWNASSEWLGEATVTEHVHRLRLKLEQDPSQPRLLRTVRGVGYQLVESA
ncbi:two-component system, OmpR family, alkaline phosphatase synthesis response regulator PhoP [Pedococcus dokdonensis]|uniref:Two-component system, OmpR family, alkaline phosphatase synthesis response regulator PhoP n=1 Tax=Pedococcus dokdonensis TaxID=443156 RepID=A0A1H0N778_9MICO|nr:response regulator [Pedococcus dokdonensis]SDO88544.1 two-component system, OmpR family, alkaline phosphatase synthesis response regulator PhoP [Pedococcus dokdonensis]